MTKSKVLALESRAFALLDAKALGFGAKAVDLVNMGELGGIREVWEIVSGNSANSRSSGPSSSRYLLRRTCTYTKIQ